MSREIINYNYLMKKVSFIPFSPLGRFNFTMNYINLQNC